LCEPDVIIGFVFWVGRHH